MASQKHGVYFNDGDFFVRVDRADEDGEWQEVYEEATRVVAFKNGKRVWEKEKDFYSREELLQRHHELLFAPL